MHEYVGELGTTH